MEQEDVSIEITRQIEEIRKAILAGEISLLEFELTPIFEDLKKSLNKYNLTNYSGPFQDACLLLSEKFEELRVLINNLDKEKIFIKYLEKKPSDEEICSLLAKSWRKVFYLESISFNFLNYSTERYLRRAKEIGKIEHLTRSKARGKFLVEIPEQKFTEKMEGYYDKIFNLLPCKFFELFGNERDQIKLYEYFVYILHLIQLGYIKYNKNQDIVYK